MLTAVYFFILLFQNSSEGYVFLTIYGLIDFNFLKVNYGVETDHALFPLCIF